MSDKTYPPAHLKSRIKQAAEKIYGALKAEARDHGWCLLAHGSMERDLDVVAVPWTEAACGITTLVEALRQRAAKVVNGRFYKSAEMGEKPFGRRTITMYGDSDDDILVSCEKGTFPFIDLSIVDLRPFLSEQERST